MRIRICLRLFTQVVGSVLLGGLLRTPVQAATVLSVGDGDTITISNGAQKTRVRLACIDAPETSQPPYGKASRQALQSLLPIGAEVTIRSKAIDRYGRTFGDVLRGNININQRQVSSGNAFVFWKYISGCDRQTYSRLENDARVKGVGVWSVPGGIERPWDYRHSRRGGRSGT